MAEKSKLEQRKDEKEEKSNNQPDLPEELETQISLILQRAQDARDAREQEHREFDGMTYMDDYQANLDAKNTYLTPKINDDEVRVNTSTTEKKLEAMVNELLSMNLQHEVLAFDHRDREIKQLGKDFEDIVTRTNKIEKEEDEWKEIVYELVSQRAVFVKEIYEEKKTRDRKRKHRKVKKQLVPGRKIFLGDINIPIHRLDEQPYIIEYDRVHYSQAQAMFGDNDRWDLVQPGGSQNDEFAMDEFYEWRMFELNDDEVEIIRYYSVPDDEYQVVVNSIPMKESQNKLPWDYDGYNIAAAHIKPMRYDFAYGKPPVASAKTLQGLENEMIRNLVRKFRQALEPPLATESNDNFSRDMWAPASITTGVNPNQLDSLIDHQGVTNSEFNMYQLITNKTEEFVGMSRLAQGLGSESDKTATEALEQLKQGIKMLGLAVFALMKLRRDLTFMRIKNVLENLTKPQGSKLDKKAGKIRAKYRQFTLKDTNIEGGRGTKIIQMRDRSLDQDEIRSIKKFEDRQEKRGNLVRVRSINLKKLRDIDVFWWVNVVQKEREGSAVHKLMFQEKLGQAAEIQNASGGQVQVNWNKIAEDHEVMWNSSDLYKIQADRGLQPQQGEQGEEAAEVKTQAKELLTQLGQKGAQTPNARALLEGPRSQARKPEPDSARARA